MPGLAAASLSMFSVAEDGLVDVEGARTGLFLLCWLEAAEAEGNLLEMRPPGRRENVWLGCIALALMMHLLQR